MFTPLPVRPSDLFVCVPTSEEHPLPPTETATPSLKMTATLEALEATVTILPPALRDFTETFDAPSPIGLRLEPTTLIRMFNFKMDFWSSI